MVVSLVFTDNGSLHDDLVLSIGGRDFVCDTYYLALDQGVSADREDVGKIRMVLARLMEQWLDALKVLRDGRVVYLPFDFSDQSTGWLACERTANEVEISRGWALLEGWAIMPSALGDMSVMPSGFRVDGPTVHATLVELVESVRHSLALVK